MRLAPVLLLVTLIAACAGGPDKPKPTELTANPALLRVRQAWTAQIGAVAFPLDVKVNGDTVTLASSDGVVQSVDARSGASLWRSDKLGPLAAGVGSDGRRTAVVTRENELVVLEAGRELWRQKLTAPSYTAPLVAGARVFLLTADRSVSAFDGASGRKLWTQQRPGEALVLRQAGVLLAVGDTAVVGMGGRLVGLNPANGVVRWDVAIAAPRGTNDIERLVDLVGSVARDGNVVCARAFQAAVGCVDTTRGTLLWTKPAAGLVGLQGDDKFVFGVEGDGKVIAWRRADGDRAWVTERLRFRGLGAPLLAGRAIVVGEETGLVHWLARDDGAALTRMPTDGSAVVTAPVLAGGTLVVVTRNGGIFGFKPE
jgi:outer membrane assembly lipoprotein YfgL